MTLIFRPSSQAELGGDARSQCRETVVMLCRKRELPNPTPFYSQSAFACGIKQLELWSGQPRAGLCSDSTELLVGYLSLHLTSSGGLSPSSWQSTKNLVQFFGLVCVTGPSLARRGAKSLGACGSSAARALHSVHGMVVPATATSGGPEEQGQQLLVLTVFLRYPPDPLLSLVANPC